MIFGRKMFYRHGTFLYWRKVATINWTKWPHDRRMVKKFTIYIIAFLRNWIRVFSDWKVTIPITQVLLWGKLSVIPRQDKILIFSQLWKIFYFLPGLMLMWWIMKNCDTFKHVIFHCSLLRKQPHCARWRMENIWKCILCILLYHIIIFTYTCLFIWCQQIQCPLFVDQKDLSLKIITSSSIFILWTHEMKYWYND